MKKLIPKGKRGAAFYVGSMFDAPGRYMAKINAWTGEIVGHVNRYEEEPEFDLYEEFPEVEREQENKNQLALF